MPNRDPLTLRQQAILRALVHAHVDTGEPIASRALADQPGLRVSSATIRHELGELEERSFIRQPHTSAGRIPTDHGYRCYVDDLMAPRDLSEAQRRRIENALDTDGLLEDKLERLTGLLAQLSPYAAIIQLPEDATLTVREVHLGDLGHGRVLVIVVSGVGAVRQRVVHLEWEELALTAEDLPRIARFLTEHMATKPLGLAVATLDDVVAEAGDLKGLLTIGRVIAQQMLDPDREPAALLLDGMAHLMTQPEFRDAARARALLEVLEEKRLLHTMLSDSDRPARLGRVTFAIGQENGVPGVEECTLALATYSLGATTGRIALLGPVRMRYRHASALLGYASAKLTDLLAA